LRSSAHVAMLTIALAGRLKGVQGEFSASRELETSAPRQNSTHAREALLQEFGRYPPSVDALVKTNNIRFLRKEIYGPDNWQRGLEAGEVCQNKAPTAMASFGVPLSGSTIAGTGPSGGNGLPAEAVWGGGSGLFGGNNAAGASSFSQQTATPDPNAAQPQDANNASAGNGSTTGDASTAGSNTDQPQGRPDRVPERAPGFDGPDFWRRGDYRLLAQQPEAVHHGLQEEKSLQRVEFVYDPLAEQMMMPRGNTGSIGQPASATTTPVGGSPSGVNTPNNNASTTASPTQQ